MDSIQVKAEYKLIFNNNPPSDTPRVRFSIPIKAKILATVDVSYENQSLLVEVDKYLISDELLSALQERRSLSLETCEENLKQEIIEIGSIITSSAQEVLYLIKHILGHYVLSDRLVPSSPSAEWRVKSGDWRRFPRRSSGSAETRFSIRLDEKTAKGIQSSLDSDVRSLLGMRHLHRAKNEIEPRYKWIDATIAAELAIKETLIRAKPVLEKLLLEVPAPSLAKLYGPILKEYLGERSPYLKSIENGMMIRNKLIHNPTAEIIDHQKAIDYVNDIEAAIFHLLGLLYPEDILVIEVRRITNILATRS